MKKVSAYIFIFAIGGYAGWQIRGILPVDSAQISSHSKPNMATETITVATQAQDDNTTTTGVKDILFSPQLLSSDQIGIVLELLKQNLTVEEKMEIDQKLIQYAETLLDSPSELPKVERKLTALLGNEDTKTAILSIFARLYERRHRFQKAIDTLFELRSYANFSDEQQEINERIENLSQRHINTLNEKNEIDHIREFYDFLVAKEPGNYEVQMRFAEFEFLHGNYERSRQLLEVLVHHSEFTERASILLSKNQHQISLLEAGGFPVPVSKQGDHYIVSAIVNDQEPIKLIIDTGASLTVLSPEVVHSLGISEEDAVKFMNFNTANGMVNAPIVMIDKLNVQNHIVQNLRVGVLPAFNNSSVQGLLGMNFLRRFSFFINQENLTLELSPAQNLQ